ncbi:MAG: hypothetical protein FWH26_11445, partial [Oscillospiraceae bacterium]|nr:hypothetical protein [Oscillospiraceae bacterium]
HWGRLEETGKLLEALAELPPELLTLSGAELIKPAAGKQAKWEGAVLPPDFKDLLGVLKDHGFEERITGLQISASPLPDVIYQGRIRIKFGSGLPAGSSSLTVREVLGEKLRVGREALRQIEEENPHQRGVLDLSAYGKAYFTPDWTEQFSTFVN